MSSPAEPAGTKARTLPGDLWGGLSAMLVAVPSAIAFGVTVLSPLGSSHAAQGALAGILGAVALGLLAPALGGTPRLITAPCAPAAAVLSAQVIELAAQGVPAESVLLRLTLVCVVAAVLQLIAGLAGAGRLIKYMPYPVVSGYLTGVGLIIVASQFPKLVGAASGVTWSAALTAPRLWNGYAIAVGVLTIAAMLIGPRLTKALPAAILGLVIGVLAYFGLSLANPSLLGLEHNPLVIGRLDGAGDGLLSALRERGAALRGLGLADVTAALVPGATLAILLSIDTLKTCVVLDALTRSRHDSNRELVGQGLANLAASTAGGIPGAGQMGATLVNLSSGARTRVSGIVEGALALLAFLVLGSLLAWVPIAALAGILIVVGLRMIDWRTVHFLRSRATMLDFLVILAVVIVAESYSLIAASGVGVGLAVLLFIREQAGTSVVHRKTYGSETFSRQARQPEAMKVLHERGDQTAIFELQGSLFFGTADGLYRALEPELKAHRRYLILDLQRVQSVDLTAAHVLEQIEDVLAERGGCVLFSDLPRALPSGRDMQRYFDEVGLVRSERRVQVFDELDNALEWVEDRLLEEEQMRHVHAKALELADLDLFAGRKAETLAALEACVERRSFKSGERIFARGDSSDELYLIRRGAVRIVLPLSAKEAHHLATFRRGSFFGEMAFLDREPRSADAIALDDTDLFVLQRSRIDTLSAEHPRLVMQLYERLSRALATRLRYTTAEVRALRRPGGA
jgi:sulfate permease, SulP family